MRSGSETGCMPETPAPSETENTCRRLVPVGDGIVVPFDEPYIAILGDDNGDGVMQLMAEPVSGPVPGADPFTQFRLREVPLTIQGVINRSHFIDISREHPAKTEEFVPLGHDHRAICSRKGGNEMGDIENCLIQERDRFVLAGDVFMPADNLFSDFPDRHKVRQGCS